MVATTAGSEVTKANIQAVFTSSNPPLHPKQDILEYDPKKTPFLSLLNSIDVPVKQISLLTGYVEGA